MAQHDFNIANATFPSVRSDINSALTAINTSQSGTSRPASAVAGTIWLDTTSATTPTLKYYDGADDISLATLDHTANTVNWLDSTVSITGLSTTATGTVLTLTDSASTSTVNLIIDNQKEVRFRETTANGTNYIALKAPASVASDLTFTLPATDGASGQALVTNGSGVLSFASSGLAWQSVKTSNFTAVKGQAYPINTTSASIIVTLPATPSLGDQVQVVDYAGTFDTNKLIIDGNGEDIEESPNNFQLTGEREGVIFTYIDATQGWIATSGINEGTDALELETYIADFLVIAGGGGGGSDGATGGKFGGGGGGAGGYRTSTGTSGGGGSSESSLALVEGIVYTITVGAGGSGGIYSGSTNTQGIAGSNSSISGTNITTITSLGGGGGSGSFQAGSSGGSGGGGAESPFTTGLSGTANQGFSGGNSTGNDLNGGGGGSGSVGRDGNGSPAKAGGDGLASTITGSSVTRAGGGGGASAGAGGSGGGGTGTGGSGNATVNTGSGGGASQNNYVSGAGSGAKGVVILRMPTAKYTGTTTGSPTVSTSGANTILVFNDSGSYTG